MIGVIDYGASNLRSVANTLKHLGIEITIAATPEQLNGVEKIILPGVGAFAPGMEQLYERGFVDYVREVAAQGIPILGICLGMQFLLDESEEDGIHIGLGLIPGRCVRFTTDLKVPHMGWNQLMHSETHPFMSGVASGSSYAYFVHSYLMIASSLPPITIIPIPPLLGAGRCWACSFTRKRVRRLGSNCC
jgi:glutamine amidotransferase